MNELGAALAGLLKNQPETLLFWAAVAIASLILITLVLLITVIVITRRQARMLRGVNGSNLEEALQRQTDALLAMERTAERTIQVGSENANALQSCFQRIGMVRYDAFPDVGGEQSFSVALLDATGNGIVFSGLHSRHDLRVYAKQIIAGDSATTLTPEERTAIRSAAPASTATAVTGGRARERV